MFKWLEKLCISFLVKRGYYICSSALITNSFKSLSSEIARKDKELELKTYTIRALSIALDDMEEEMHGDTYE